MLSDIQTLLPGHPWHTTIQYLDSIDSTNTYAKRLAAEDAPEGTVVIANHQTGGRGRLGRSFSSPAGLGLYLSVILRPKCPPLHIMHLTCSAGVAAAQAVEAASGLKPGIKWTNDLVLGKRKLGGILTEMSIDPATGLVDYAIVGIGINCRQTEDDFPPEIRSIATSLALAGSPTDTAALAAALIDALHQMSDGLLTRKEEMMELFAQRCVTVGNEISIVRGGSIRHALAVGVDKDGGLQVVFPDGTKETITSGEVSIRGMYGYL